jgi:hypothetical protein
MNLQKNLNEINLNQIKIKNQKNNNQQNFQAANNYLIQKTKINNRQKN